MVLLRLHRLSLLRIHSLWLRPLPGQMLPSGRRLLSRSVMTSLRLVAGSTANSLQMPRPLDADGYLWLSIMLMGLWTDTRLGWWPRASARGLALTMWRPLLLLFAWLPSGPSWLLLLWRTWSCTALTSPRPSLMETWMWRFTCSSMRAFLEGIQVMFYTWSRVCMA